MPKSVTLACCFPSSSTLAAFTSRWMMLLSCRYATPVATSSAMRQSSRGEIALVGCPSALYSRLCSRLCSEPPCRYSSTMAGKPCCMHVPRHVQIEGWRIWLRIFASCTKLRSASRHMPGSTLSTLTATNDPFHSPFHTLLPPPSPSTRWSTSEPNCGWSHSMSSGFRAAAAPSPSRLPSSFPSVLLLLLLESARLRPSTPSAPSPSPASALRTPSSTCEMSSFATETRNVSSPYESSVT
mmetsp:Transcript_42660/g.106160  ORF Transcript_42660/g.106160 Transcript_42660/m.106160 type:complete len:240 (+) Transcript_42660:908-1627(+)